MICFECGKTAHHQHHPIPASMGGTKTIDLCHDCHGKIHGIDFSNHGNLIKSALALRKLAGIPIGRPKKEVDERLIIKAKSLLKRGASFRQVAMIVGIDKSTLWRRLRGWYANCN